MKIDEKILKCVAFLGYQMADTTFRMAGTAFFVADEKTKIGYAVTAKHVIDGIKNLGLDKVFFRLNLIEGDSTWLSAPIDDWYFDGQKNDVAILKAGILSVYDHMAIGYPMVITDKIMQDNEVGLGDEVFITGLFKHHHGNKKNIPIVRVGNLACITEERVTTRIGEIDAYLIEARSIGGLSGSPVFLNLGNIRYLSEGLRTANQGVPRCFLIGLMHGHYDASSASIDSNDGVSEVISINTGIGIVIPAHIIFDVIKKYETLCQSS